MQPTTRYGFARKKKGDHTQGVIIGSVVAVAAVLLLVVYALNRTPAGYDVIKPEKSTESLRTKLAEERKQKEKEIEKQKQATTAHASPSGGKKTPK